MPGQLIFNLPTQDNFNSQDFFVSSSNSDVVKLLNFYPQWHNNGIIIYGNKKSGKTHLAHIWKLNSNAIIYDFKNDQDMSKIIIKCNVISFSIFFNYFGRNKNITNFKFFNIFFSNLGNKS